ncbi:hypothetical protein Efla_007487 [Eimeria flavescens]
MREPEGTVADRRQSDGPADEASISKGGLEPAPPNEPEASPYVEAERNTNEGPPREHVSSNAEGLPSEAGGGITDKGPFSDKSLADASKAEGPPGEAVSPPQGVAAGGQADSIPLEPTEVDEQPAADAAREAEPQADKSTPPAGEEKQQDVSNPLDEKQQLQRVSDHDDKTASRRPPKESAKSSASKAAAAEQEPTEKARDLGSSGPPPESDVRGTDFLSQIRMAISELGGIGDLLHEHDALLLRMRSRQAKLEELCRHLSVLTSGSAELLKLNSRSEAPQPQAQVARRVSLATPPPADNRPARLNKRAAAAPRHRGSLRQQNTAQRGMAPTPPKRAEQQ